MAEEDELVASLPVFLSHSLSDGAKLQLFQYPLYQRDRPLPVPASAAQRGQTVTSRWRPHTNRVEMELPLDMRASVYDGEKGAEYAEACERLGKIPVPGAAPQVKQERQDGPARFDSMRLESASVPNATEYLVGTMRDGELHLTPLHAVLQMRPSMQHVDLLGQVEENERRRERGAPVSDDEGEAREAREARKASSVIPLNVSVRTEGRAARGTELTQRDAEAERWVDLRWMDADAPGAREIADDQLLARSRARLYCDASVADFL